MSDGKTFHLTLVTASEPVMDVDVTSVVFPAVDGKVGVLAKRAPFIAAVGDGRLTVRRAGRRYRYFISGGVADLYDGVLTIVAERCQSAGG